MSGVGQGGDSAVKEGNRKERFNAKGAEIGHRGRRVSGFQGWDRKTVEVVEAAARRCTPK